MNEPLKRLYRSRDEAQLGGVCAGLGAYLHLDPILVRVVTVTVTFVTGFVPGLLSYLVAWIIIPREQALPARHAGPPEHPYQAQS